MSLFFHIFFIFLIFPHLRTSPLLKTVIATFSLFLHPKIWIGELMSFSHHSINTRYTGDRQHRWEAKTEHSEKIFLSASTWKIQCLSIHSPQMTQMVQQLRIRTSKHRLVYHQFHKQLSNKHCLIQYSSSILSSAFCQKTVFSLKIMFSCSLGNLVSKGKFENIPHYETWVIYIVF